MTTPEVSREELQPLLETMWLVRAFEEKASEIYAAARSMAFCTWVCVWKV